jgi:hypothetical protein
MTGIITTRMPYSAGLSANQANTQQAGKEFRSAIGEKKLAFAPAIPALGLAAIITVALVGCWALIQNSIGNSKNEPLPTPEELARSIANLFQGKSDEFTPIARKVLANPEIRGKLDAATGGTVLRADVGKQGGAENAKVVFRSLYNQALQKSLANPRLTPKQRADLIALESYVFMADDSKANESGANASEQGGANNTGATKKTGKLKKPKKPKFPKASKPVVNKLTGETNNLFSASNLRTLFSNPQALPQLKQMLEISKLTFTSKVPASIITSMERFILLAEKNFFSGRVPNRIEVMEMGRIALRLGWSRI